MKNRRFSNIEISAFCGQLALILKSGISSIEGITILLEDSDAPEERSVLEAIQKNLEETGSLHNSLAETGLFPPYLLHMVEIGEETGTLDEVMAALSAHYNREDSISRSIRSAVTYPAVMAGMMVLVIVILLVKVMPIFNQVFVQLGTEMTGVSRVLMDLGSAMNRYSVFFLCLLVLLVALFLYATRSQKGKRQFREIGCHFRALAAIYEEIAACRFASGMALTLKSGIDPERGMELACGLNDDPRFQKKLDECRERLQEGDDLSESLHRTGVFTGIYARMAAVGQKTGSMDQVMSEIAALYQDDIDNRMNQALSVLEPTLVIGLSLIVGIILMSVMLPLMGIMSSL